MFKNKLSHVESHFSLMQGFGSNYTSSRTLRIFYYFVCFIDFGYLSFFERHPKSQSNYTVYFIQYAIRLMFSSEKVRYPLGPYIKHSTFQKGGVLHYFNASFHAFAQYWQNKKVFPEVIFSVLLSIHL